VDRTIVDGSSGVDFLVAGVRRRVFPPAALLYIPLVSVRLHLGLLRPGRWGWRLSILRGLRRDALEDLARESYRRLRPRIFPQARGAIRAARERGGGVVLATSSLDLIVKPLADDLGIDELLASSAEFRDGVCTGRFTDPPLLGERKRERALEYLRGRGVDPRQCAFYSDSAYDLPLLEAVGRPVVVNPDAALSRRARARGWPVLRWSRRGAAGG